jgi:hypothetical protein
LDEFDVAKWFRFDHDPDFGLLCRGDVDRVTNKLSVRQN